MIAYNRDAQTWGWFDVSDDRAWPLSLHQKNPKTSALYLESLKLTFVGNLYAVHGSEGLFNWGVPWKRHEKFSTLDDVRTRLGLEQDSVVVPFSGAAYSARDFRIPADSPAARMGCYPQGEVPGVRLGTTAR